MAVRFDGVGDRLVATSGLPAGDFTYTVWVNQVVSRATYISFVALESLDGAAYTELATGVSGAVLWVYANTGNTADTPLTTGAWHKVGVTVTGTTARLYVGTEAGAIALIGTATVAATARQRLFLGSNGVDNWLNGRLAAFKVWTAALSQAEVAAELTQYAPVRTANLLRYHPFIDSPADLSGNGHTLTAGSTPVTWEAGPDIPATSGPEPGRYLLTL